MLTPGKISNDHNNKRKETILLPILLKEMNSLFGQFDAMDKKLSLSRRKYVATSAKFVILLKFHRNEK